MFVSNHNNNKKNTFDEEIMQILVSNTLLHQWTMTNGQQGTCVVACVDAASEVERCQKKQRASLKNIFIFLSPTSILNCSQG